MKWALTLMLATDNYICFDQLRYTLIVFQFFTNAHNHNKVRSTFLSSTPKAKVKVGCTFLISTYFVTTTVVGSPITRTRGFRF